MLRKFPERILLSCLGWRSSILRFGLAVVGLGDSLVLEVLLIFVVQWLVEKSADQRYRAVMNEGLIHYAARNGYVKSVACLVEKNRVPVNSPDHHRTLFDRFLES